MFRKKKKPAGCKHLQRIQAVAPPSMANGQLQIFTTLPKDVFYENIVAIGALDWLCVSKLHRNLAYKYFSRDPRIKGLSPQMLETFILRAVWARNAHVLRFFTGHPLTIQIQRDDWSGILFEAIRTRRIDFVKPLWNMKGSKHTVHLIEYALERQAPDIAQYLRDSVFADAPYGYMDTNANPPSSLTSGIEVPPLISTPVWRMIDDTGFHLIVDGHLVELLTMVNTETGMPMKFSELYIKQQAELALIPMEKRVLQWRCKRCRFLSHISVDDCQRCNRVRNTPYGFCRCCRLIAFVPSLCSICLQSDAPNWQCLECPHEHLGFMKNNKCKNCLPEPVKIPHDGVIVC